MTTATVLHLDIDFPRNPTEVQADVIFRQLSEQTGDKISGVKLSGYWLIYRNDELLTGRPEIGLPNVKNFDKAIANGLGIAVCRAVPIKK